jgi:hypothetical protein
MLWAQAVERLGFTELGTPAHQPPEAVALVSVVHRLGSRAVVHSDRLVWGLATGALRQLLLFLLAQVGFCSLWDEVGHLALQGRRVVAVAVVLLGVFLLVAAAAKTPCQLPLGANLAEAAGGVERPVLTALVVGVASSSNGRHRGKQ